MLSISNFYCVVDLENYQDMREPLLDFCLTNSIKGTIILSEEGINATVCANDLALNELLGFIHLDHRLADVSFSCKTYSEFYPFQRMKVLLRNEIVSLKVPGVSPKDSGLYIEPKLWDEFISRPDVKVIDTRNFYETQLGSFDGSIFPMTQNFREFPDWFHNWVCDNDVDKSQNIAMFCTGGIRCEKSTSFLKKLGFDNVYHLKGGIIAYLKENQNVQSKKWFGDCFIFDDRVALTSNLEPSMSIRCRTCGTLATTDDLKNTTKGTVVCLKCISQE